ncbi:MAG TPA: hypothetical protein VD999_03115 [Vitreimonas sp.]|nr:hypothetical protein [Vitreimonas sp.]
MPGMPALQETSYLTQAYLRATGVQVKTEKDVATHENRGVDFDVWVNILPNLLTQIRSVAEPWLLKWYFIQRCKTEEELKPLQNFGMFEEWKYVRNSIVTPTLKSEQMKQVSLEQQQAMKRCVRIINLYFHLVEGGRSIDKVEDTLREIYFMEDEAGHIESLGDDGKPYPETEHANLLLNYAVTMSVLFRDQEQPPIHRFIPREPITNPSPRQENNGYKQIGN